jgi:hypothetical protein
MPPLRRVRDETPKMAPQMAGEGTCVRRDKTVGMKKTEWESHRRR